MSLLNAMMTIKEFLVSDTDVLADKAKTSLYMRLFLVIPSDLV